MMSTGCTEYVLAGGVLASRVIGQPEVVSLSACGGWVLCESYRLQSGLVRLSGGGWRRALAVMLVVVVSCFFMLSPVLLTSIRTSQVLSSTRYQLSN